MHQKTSKPAFVKVRSSKPLLPQFSSLARQVADWKGEATERRTLGVLGAAHGVGASTVAINLACTLAAGQGRVLLIEADFGANSLAIAGRRKLAGLGEVLLGEVDPDSATQATNIENLALMGSGCITTEESLLLPLRDLEPLLEDLSSSYSYIIVDLPAAILGGNCFSLANQLDAVVIVCDNQHVDPDAIQRIAKRLSSTQLLGIVLNKSS